MDKENFENMMDKLEKPEIKVDEQQKSYRLTLLNTKKSSWTGFILLIFPMLFLIGVIFDHYLGLDWLLLTGIYKWISKLDQQYGDDSLINWLFRFLLLLGPPLAAGINLLSIIHVRYEKVQKELIFSLKLRRRNLWIILICTIIFMIFFSYLILENL